MTAEWNINREGGASEKREGDETNYVKVVGSVAFVEYEQLNSCKACLCGDSGLPHVPKQGGRPT